MRLTFLVRSFSAGAVALASAAFAAPVLTDTTLTATQVINSGSVSGPTCMVFLSTNDILVGEKDTGLVKRVLNGAVQGAPVLNLPVNADSERGLLGMVLDPQFASNQRVYVFYTRAASDGGTAIDQRISRFTWNGTALAGETLVLTLPVTPGSNHDGGIIKFGPPTAAPADQKLYAIIGDLNRNNQTENYATGAAPDDTGVVVRVNPDGSTPSGTEKGPFFDVPGANAALQRQYAYGIRNSFGMDFDPVTGALWDTENGPGDYDEVNRIDPAFNSGWERVMGLSTAPNAIKTGSGLADLVQFGGVGTYSEPEFSWRQIVAPTSIHFLSSAALGAGYQYDCFVGCNSGGKLYRFEPNPTRTGFALTGGLADTVLDTTASDSDSTIVFGTQFPVTTDIETGPDGALYVLSLVDGQIYRIAPKDSRAENWQLYE